MKKIKLNKKPLKTFSPKYLIDGKKFRKEGKYVRVPQEYRDGEFYIVFGNHALHVLSWLKADKLTFEIDFQERKYKYFAYFRWPDHAIPKPKIQQQAFQI